MTGQGHDYDHAGSWMRRARVPQLPADAYLAVPDGDTDDRLATTVVLSYLVFLVLVLVLVGLAVWYAY
jgi:hypothetical protein